MKPIVLTAEQRKAIERRRKDTLDRRVYQRLTACPKPDYPMGGSAPDPATPGGEAQQEDWPLLASGSPRSTLPAPTRLCPLPRWGCDGGDSPHPSFTSSQHTP